jgi:hypothetical protein
MGPIRIRWRSAARIGGFALAGLIVLKLLPGLLEPPDPPPLAADVGLPRGVGKQVEVRLEPVEKEQDLSKDRRRRKHPRLREPLRRTEKKQVGEVEPAPRPQRHDRTAPPVSPPEASPPAPLPVSPATAAAPLPPPSPPPPQPQAMREFGLP